VAISAEVAGLAISVVSGAIKLGKRLDDIQAEEVALRSAVGLAFPDVKLDPPEQKLRSALLQLLRSTKNQTPDPLSADERVAIAELRAAPASTFFDLRAKCAQYGLLETIEVKTFKPDVAFQKALSARSSAWELSDEDVKRYTFFVAAGPDTRQNSLGFRISATLLDVLAEVAAQNTRFVISHEPTRRLVESVLTKFSEPDLANLTGWSTVLRSALRSTLNAVIDERDALAGSREWLERALNAVARARELSPKRDDFVIGLFEGRGINELFRGVLTEGADYISEGDPEIWEDILADVLTRAAEKAEGAPGFEEFFQENWHSLVGAGFRSLQVHGPKLLDEDEAILKTTLTAAVGALADAFDQGRPSAETFTSVVEAAIAVFADPGVLAPAIREPWLRDMIASVGSFVRDKGLRASFSQPALEEYARDALMVLSRYPEVLGVDEELVQSVLTDVLSGMAKVENFGVGALADAAVEGALSAIAENVDLLDMDYASVVGQLAGGLAERVAVGGIGGLQAEEILAEVTEVVATNEEIFLRARDGLAEAVIDAILDAAAEDAKGVLVGTAVVATVRRVMHVMAARGKLLVGDMEAVQERLKEIVAAGLAQASKVLGKQLAQQDVPEALVEMIDMLARGEELPDLDSSEFAKLFGKIADDVTKRAA